MDQIAANLQTILISSASQTGKIFLLVLLVGLLVYYAEILIGGFIARLFGPGVSFLIMNHLTFPGVVHHEFSHAIVAVLTGAKVTEINLLPKGDLLGYVKFLPRGPLLFKALQTSLSSIAPAFLGLCTTYLMLKYIPAGLSGGWSMLYLYIVFSVFIHASLSPLDVKNFFTGVIPTLLLVFAGCVGWNIWMIVR